MAAPPEQSGENFASPEHPQLYAEQVRLLYRNAPFGLIATLINSVVLVFILRSVVPHRILTTWFVCILLISTARLVLLARFRRVQPEASDIGRWGTWFVIGLALAGIIWGSAGIVLYPVESVIHQAFLAFVLGGMAIGAAGAFSVSKPAFIAYTLPSLAPLIVRFLTAGDEIHLAMGGMSLLFFVLITGIAFRISRVTLTSLLLRFEKNSLVDYLSSAKNDLEKLNRELSSEIAEHKKAEEELKRHREHLEELVEERTSELEKVNRELEAFIYSVSHDLRAPLRSISGFGKWLMEDQAGKLDEQGRDYLRRMNLGADRMSRLIEDLLSLSRISRQEIERTKLDLSKIASLIVSDLRASDPSRSVEVNIAEGLSAYGDESLITIVFTNLLGNAWKFTSKTADARIEFGTLHQEGRNVYYIRDNGAGFDAQHRERMFLPFQRLHSDKEFEGTGIGLAIAARVIHRHGGEIWAEGKTGEGATVYFRLE
jgi:signal transduction histidine kinase